MRQVRVAVEHAGEQHAVHRAPRELVHLVEPGGVGAGQVVGLAGAAVGAERHVEVVDRGPERLPRRIVVLVLAGPRDFENWSSPASAGKLMPLRPCSRAHFASLACVLDVPHREVREADMAFRLHGQKSASHWLYM